MKFIVEKSALVAAMTRIAGIVDKRQIIPILGNVLIESETAGVIRLRSSNLDMEACETVECDLLTEVGAITVPAHALLDIARNAPDGASLKFDLGARLAVQYGRSRFQLSHLAAEDFPAIMNADIPGEFKIPAATLRDMLIRTSYAMAYESSLAHLQGVRLEARDGELWAAATNFKVLAMVKIDAPEGCGDMGVTMPARMVDAVIGLLASSDADATVAFSDRKIAITCGATVIAGKILEGSFVNFPIATEKPVSVKFARDEMISMIKRVRATTDKADGIKLEFAAGTITATTRNTEAEGADEIGSEYDGPTGSVGFGAKFLLDVLSGVTGDIAEFQFGENFSGPVVVRAPIDPGTIVNMGTQRA